MKTKKELSAIKKEYENLIKILAELSEDELKQVAGGESTIPIPRPGEFWESWNPGMDIIHKREEN